MADVQSYLQSNQGSVEENTTQLKSKFPFFWVQAEINFIGIKRKASCYNAILAVERSASIISVHKTFKIKRMLSKKMKQNRPIPQSTRIGPAIVLDIMQRDITGEEQSLDCRLSFGL